MSRKLLKGANPMKWPRSSTLFAFAFLVVAMLFCDVQAARALPVSKVMAIPAFARKYGLPCSACHTAWPELNNFGQTFRDNGYQLMNDRDSPIWQNPSYFPIAFRITPNWHRESTDHQVIDAVPGSGALDGVGKVTQAGFDLSGMDLWSGGTLYKNISFILLPSSDATATWHFESAFVRFDNIKGSSWFNFKFGKFELDNLISEKRFLFLSGNGGLYQIYHFNVPGGTNDFGYGDNQIGIELMGHSKNSYTRYSVAMMSSNEGGVGLRIRWVPVAPRRTAATTSIWPLVKRLTRLALVKAASVCSALEHSHISVNVPRIIKLQAALPSSVWATSRFFASASPVTFPTRILSSCRYLCTDTTTHIWARLSI